jgi:hypothetical protein
MADWQISEAAEKNMPTPEEWPYNAKSWAEAAEKNMLGPKRPKCSPWAGWPN